MEIGEKWKKRKENYINFYNIMIEELNLPKQQNSFLSTLFCPVKKDKLYDENWFKIHYFLGSHFSNSVNVPHFLTRLFPFTLTVIEIQEENL